MARRTVSDRRTERTGTTRTASAGCLLVVLGAVLAGPSWAGAEGRDMDEGGKTLRAEGSFEITMKPLETYNQAADAKVGRMSIDKTYAGDLAGTSVGEMLSGGSPAEGSAGYVAIERVTASLAGREGSFLLQHSGTMTPDSRQLTITVVPASGTGELAGLTGTMAIEIRDGQHFYVFEYDLPLAAP